MKTNLFRAGLLLLPMVALALAPISAFAASSGTGTASLSLTGGSLSVGSIANATINGTIGATATGNLNSAVWGDSTGTGAGWNGSIAITSFNYTGSWSVGGSHALGATSSGQFTGTNDGANYVVSVLSCVPATSTLTFNVSGNETVNNATATLSTTGNTLSNVGTHGVTITWAPMTSTVSCQYTNADSYTIKVGTQATSALALNDSASGSITANSGTVSANPAFVNQTATVSGGSVTTAGTAVKFLSAAANSGMGSYTVVPAANVSSDANSWAATYAATATYTIATGP